MKKEDKNLVIEALGAQLAEYAHFYLVNIEGLDAAKTSELRRACFKQEIKLLVAKNTLLQKALEKKGIDAEIFEQYAVSTENGHKALYTFYHNLMSNSVLCTIDDNGTVTEYKTLKGMVSDNEYKFVRSIYDMDSFEIGGHRYVAILADKVTNGGIAPYIVILNVDGGEPKVTSAGEVKIDIKKYNASATSVFDGETELFLVDSFDDTLDTYMTVTDDGVSVVGNEYKELNGDLAMAQ